MLLLLLLLLLVLVLLHIHVIVDVLANRQHRGARCDEVCLVQPTDRESLIILYFPSFRWLVPSYADA